MGKSSVLLLLLTSCWCMEAQSKAQKLGAGCRAGKAKDCAGLWNLAANAEGRAEEVETIRRTATENLDQANLVSLIRLVNWTAPEMQALVERVTEPARLVEVAQLGIDRIAEPAVRRLEDEALLAVVADKGDSASARKIAVTKLSDQALLARIATGARDEEIRLAAVSRLQDAGALAAIALGEGNERVRLAATKAIADEATLLKIASDGKASRDLKQAALDGIKNQGTLAQLAEDPKSPLARAARERLTDQAALARIVKSSRTLSASADSGDDLRDVGKLTDQALLAELAKSAAGEHVRRLAVERLTDKTVLAALARADASSEIRTLAAERLAILKADVTVSGTLTEASIGPLRATTVDLTGFATRLFGTVSLARTKTDDEGRFVFRGLRAGDRAVSCHGSDLPARVQVPATGKLDLGRVVVENDQLVTQAFAGLCRQPPLVAPAPAGDAVFFFRRPGDVWEHNYAHLKRLAWTPPWKAALCIDESRSATNTYVDERGRSRGTGYTVLWQVRVVRLSDSQAFERLVSAGPPPKTTSSSDEGDPLPDLKVWLQTLQ